MRIIGLTGGIASGKSTVARLLQFRGAEVVDADQLAREIVVPGASAYRQIVAAFGDAILAADRSIDRKALGAVVFADPAARQRLEAITHPAIRALADEKLAELDRRGTALCFYMAPLLIEAGASDRTNGIWVVYVSRDTQLERLMKRDGIGREEAMQRIAAQMPMEEKIRHGTIIIDNNGSPEELERQVDDAWLREIRGSGIGG